MKVDERCDLEVERVGSIEVLSVVGHEQWNVCLVAIRVWGC